MMDKDTHDKSLIRLRYHLEKDIRELYYTLRKQGQSEQFEFKNDHYVYSGMLELPSQDGMTTNVAVFRDDGDFEVTRLEKIQVEDLNSIYICLWKMLNR